MTLPFIKSYTIDRSTNSYDQNGDIFHNSLNITHNIDLGVILFIVVCGLLLILILCVITYLNLDKLEKMVKKDETESIISGDGDSSYVYSTREIIHRDSISFTL